MAKKVAKIIILRATSCLQYLGGLHRGMLRESDLVKLFRRIENIAPLFADETGLEKLLYTSISLPFFSLKSNSLLLLVTDLKQETRTLPLVNN